jgi:hypothetical protein
MVMRLNGEAEMEAEMEAEIEAGRSGFSLEEVRVYLVADF